MKPGGAIINTALINSDMPNPTPLAYATTTGAIRNFATCLAQLLAEKDIRVSAVAPGPPFANRVRSGSVRRHPSNCP